MTTKIIVWSTTEDETKSESALPTLGNKKKQILVTENTVDSKVVTDNLKSFIDSLQPMLESQPTEGKYIVDEIEINLGVSANGKIGIIGQLSAGLEASVKVKIKHNYKK